jgi:hypothetical protein
MRLKLVLIVSVLLIVVSLLGGFTQVLGFSGDTPERNSAADEQRASPRLESAVNLYLPYILNKPPFRSMFGVEMESINEASGLNEMLDAGVTWVRTNSLKWSATEKTKGVYTWNGDLEDELANAGQNDIENILVINSTPEFYQLYAGIACAPMQEQYFDEFADFMRAVVERYSKPPYKIEYYEIWNEPDAPLSPGQPDNIYGCWHDPNKPAFAGQHYGKMLKVVYPAIKQANSNAKLLVGGLLLDCNPNNCPVDPKPSRFLENILSVGAGGSFDGVSFHAYDWYYKDKQGLGVYSNPNWYSAWDTTGPALSLKVDYLRSLLNSKGLYDKFLINTEVALVCYIWQGDDAHCKTDTFNESKAIYAVQSYVMAHAKQLRANIWYAVYGWNYSGLLQGDNTPYPVYDSYAFTSQMLGKTRWIETLDLGSGLYAYNFRVPLKNIWVVWSKDGSSQNVDLGDVPNAAWEWDSASNQYLPATPQQTVDIGVAPVFLEWDPTGD